MTSTKDRLIAGTASLARLNSELAVMDMLHRLTQAGLTTLDTAPAYGCGVMEAVVGRFLKARDSAAPLVRVNTKFGLTARLNLRWLQRFYFVSKVFQAVAARAGIHSQVHWEGRDLAREATASLDHSLRLLGHGVIDVFFAHEIPLVHLNRQDFLQFIRTARAQGKFQRFGLGGYRSQYETTGPGPIWEEVQVVQVESKPGSPVQTPAGWAGSIYLHGVLSPMGAMASTSDVTDRSANIRALLTEAIEGQRAEKIVAAFTRAATLEETVGAVG